MPNKISNTKSSTGYRFRDKDPIMDAVKYAMEQSGLKLSEIAGRANVSASTLYSWEYGKTRKPQHATLRSVMETCGFHERWMNANSGLVVNYSDKSRPSFKIVKKES